MVQEFLEISYDPDNKIWTSLNYPYSNQIQGSVGEKFLKTMRHIDPQKVIDYFYDTNRGKTAKEVYEQSIIVAKNMQRLGVKKGDVVVLFCMNNENVSVLTMGSVLIGAIVNFFEVHLSDEHIDYVFGILKPSVILYEEKYKYKCLKSIKRSNLSSLKYLISIDGLDQLNMQKDLLVIESPIDFEQFAGVEVKDPQNELAFLFLTSGSTGVPKVVPVTHTLIMHGCYIWWNNRNKYEPLNENSVVFSFSPLRWISQDVMLLQSMLMGIKRVSSGALPSGKHGAELLRNCQLTHLFTAPSIFNEILLQLADDDVESLKSLKMVQLGGEPPATSVLDLAKKHCVNAKMFHCYGMTEMASSITNDEDINGGKLLPGYQMQILDNEGKPLGPNQNGQIAIKPPFPLKGYQGADCKNSYTEKGFFINGDYGFIDAENNLHILGRYKDLIYSNGLMLIPNPLERIVMEMPEVCVARLTSYRKSAEEMNETAVLFVILQQWVNASQAEVSKKIFALLKKHLKPKEFAIIKHIFYVDTVPVTTCGKIDRAALRNLALKRCEID